VNFVLTAPGQLCREDSALPGDLPPKNTCTIILTSGLDSTFERIHQGLYVATGEQAGREASRAWVIVDAQSAEDFERDDRKAAAFIHFTMIRRISAAHSNLNPNFREPLLPQRS
jgi:hypothetical protein